MQLRQRKMRLPQRQEVIQEEKEKSSVASEEEDLKTLVDKAYEWDVKKKELDAKVKEAKATLLQNAEDKEWKELSGKTAKCKIGPKTTTFIGVKSFLQLLKKIGKTNLVPDLLKVQLTEAKKSLGEIVLEDIMEQDTKEYGSVSFKSLKKKG